MSYLCEQKGCAEYAVSRFTWPGRDESFICAYCAPKLRAVAGSIGLHLQLQPITVADAEARATALACEEQPK